MYKQETQEAINELHRINKRLLNPLGCTIVQQEKNHYSASCISLAISALEKQIPIKPLEVRLKHDFQGNVILKDGYCPKCKHEMSNAYLFCNKCGQAIDWSVEE